MRGFEQRQSLLGIAGVALILAVLWMLFRIVAAPDTSPTVLADAGPNAVTKVPVTTGQPVPHGSMPNVMNSNLASAVSALGNSGVVPVIVAESGGDTSGLPVRAQIPDPGTPLHADTPVLIVVGNNN
jgi:hypothetical protein